jgi:hypothetical protein
MFGGTLSRQHVLRVMPDYAVRAERAIAVGRRLETSSRKCFALNSNVPVDEFPRKGAGKYILTPHLGFPAFEGECFSSPSNEVCEHQLLDALVDICYFLPAAAAPALAAAAAFLAAAAAASAGPRDAITESRLKEAAFWRGGNLT